MIHKDNISTEHYINSIAPDYYIELPFRPEEKIEEKDVTCVFSIITEPLKLRCVGIDYFDMIDNDVLLDKRYGEYLPSHIYVFKGRPFDIEAERNRLII